MAKKIPTPSHERLIITILSILVICLFLLQKSNKLNWFNQIFPGNRVVLEVGQEKIFEKDLHQQINTLAPENPEKNLTTSQEDKLLARYITQSIILQKAADDGLISLDPSFFNSRRKDYQKRNEQVSKVKTLVEEKSVVIEGEFIAIWFDNVEAGSLGYYKAKEIAYAKIKQIYERVKNGQLTCKQAGEMIKADSSLEKIDPAYQANAYINFKHTVGEQISFNKKFSDLIWNLQEGELSELYLAKDYTQDYGYVPAVYMFGVVNDHKEAQYTSFNEWYQSAAKTYAIKRS